MKSENQTIVRCKQPIKIEKPHSRPQSPSFLSHVGLQIKPSGSGDENEESPHGSRRCSVLVAAKKDGAIFKEKKEEFLKLIFLGRG